MTEPDPKPDDLLPQRWWDEWILAWREWDSLAVPPEVQKYVTDHESRLVMIGRHADGRYFLTEIFDIGNSPPYFVGWWADIQAGEKS